MKVPMAFLSHVSKLLTSTNASHDLGEILSQPTLKNTSQTSLYTIVYLFVFINK